jgi:pantetheine-phosphate adenylyltransferase
MMIGVGALVAESSLIIGLTSDELLVNKKNKSIIQSYDARKGVLKSFIKLSKPSLQIDVCFSGTNALNIIIF